MIITVSILLRSQDRRDLTDDCTVVVAICLASYDYIIRVFLVNVQQKFHYYLFSHIKIIISSGFSFDITVYHENRMW